MNKNLIAAFKYQVKDNVRAIIIYYCILVAIIMLFSIGVATAYSTGRSTMSGLDFSTIIFIFIVGLCSFKEPFKMLMQNGVSRKTMMKSKLLSAITISFFMAVCTTVLLLLGKALASLSDNIRFISFYEQVYSPVNQSPVAVQLSSLLSNFLQYIAVFSVGLFISLVFYRCGKAGKIAVGAGVPVLLFIVLPTVDSLFFDIRISKSIIKFIDFAFGISAGKPYAAFISYAVIMVLGFALSWLLMRRADIKQ
jgi:hypothetical protein